jgi:predicted nucleotidyltransferase
MKTEERGSIKMNVVGLIVEYNPFHNGHHYHFQQAKKTNQTAVVAVMSGHFLQRGEPAVVGKFARAQMALAAGIDLVLELPTAYCIQNAELFAYGAVSTLHSLGIVDEICFGSESGEIEWLKNLAKQLVNEPRPFQEKLKFLLQQGLSYPRAYAKAASCLAELPEDLLSQPNNILGLNYLLAIERLGSPLQPLTIKRLKADYHQETITDRQIASATAIRKYIQEKSLAAIAPYVPLTTYEILKTEQHYQRFPVTWENFYPYLLQALTTKSTTELGQIYEMGEGIEYRLKKHFAGSLSFQELMHRLKTKRYTWNRLQRLLLYVLLNLKKKGMASFSLWEGVPYIRVLGFNDTGKALLHQAKSNCQIPIISRIPRDKHPMLELDICAAMTYSIGLGKLKELHEEYRRPPVFWK